MVSKIGAGAFAEVFKAAMPRPNAVLDASGSVSNDDLSGTGSKLSSTGEYVAVAVKQLVLEKIDEANLRDFYAEVALMKTLRHPNIVGFLGGCSDPNRVRTSARR